MVENIHLNEKDIIEQGDLLSEKNEWVLARDAFLKALEINESNVGSWVKLGRAFQYIGNFSRAEKSFETALQLDRTYAPAWRRLGRLFKDDLHNRSYALYCYKNALKFKEKVQGDIDQLEEKGTVPQEPPALSKVKKSVQGAKLDWVLQELKEIKEEMRKVKKINEGMQKLTDQITALPGQIKENLKGEFNIQYILTRLKDKKEKPDKILKQGLDNLLKHNLSEEKVVKSLNELEQALKKQDEFNILFEPSRKDKVLGVFKWFAQNIGGPLAGKALEGIILLFEKK